MITVTLLLLPLIGIFTISTVLINNYKTVKFIGLLTSIINMALSLIIFITFDFSLNEFQFVQDHLEVKGYNIYLGLDGISIYFVLLTTIIIPISILSNWVSINQDVKWYITIILLLESLLLAVFVVLDIFLFYISFESILPPLFLLIGLYGSSNKVRASFYLFLYTLLGSLFLLLSILSIYSTMGTTDYYALFRTNFNYTTQLYLFYGIFIAFAVKTPTIFLNTWLLKAHVESPLGGSIILAGIVLKLSLYGIMRLILPILPKASINYTYIVYLIGVITIVYASLSTLRTIDVKELIAYSSVSHAAVYLMGVFSNTIQGIEGGILLGIAHGFVSSGLFICTGGVLYDRSSTRLITYYRGITQIMPMFSMLFFILCLSNAGTPLSLNFIGEFLSIYGIFERLPLLGVLASSSIVFSAAYTIYMFNRISFGGKLSRYIKTNLPDLNKREFIMLTSLVIFTVLFGIYPSPILDGLHFSVSNIIYSGKFSEFDILLACTPFAITSEMQSLNLFNRLNKIKFLEAKCDAPETWGLFFQDSGSPQMEAIVELHNNIMFYLTIILFGVGWILLSIIRNYTKDKTKISNKYVNHGTLIELIWTITPAIILILIAFPSFKLLYLMDEVTDPNLTIDVEGHQWYWSYEYADFANIGEEPLEYDSYIVPEYDLRENTNIISDIHYSSGNPGPRTGAKDSGPTECVEHFEKKPNEPGHEWSRVEHVVNCEYADQSRPGIKTHLSTEIVDFNGNRVETRSTRTFGGNPQVHGGYECGTRECQTSICHDHYVRRFGMDKCPRNPEAYAWLHNFTLNFLNNNNNGGGNGV